MTHRTWGRLALILWLGLVGCAATPARPDPGAAARAAAASREALTSALKAELTRAMTRLKFKDYEPPYFIAYQLKDQTTVSLTGKYGAISEREDSRLRVLYAEVRVGDYSFDNFANIDNEAFRMNDYPVDRRAPLDDDLTSLRGTLWLLTDSVYKKALSDYLTKKGGAVYATDEKTDAPSFSREKPQKFRGAVLDAPLDKAAWEQTTRQITARMLKAEHVIDSNMEVTMRHTRRLLVSSEGADIADEHLIYSIQISAQARADDGMLLEHGRSFYAPTAAALPTREALEREVTTMLAELAALRAAPALDPYTGPAILAPEASGVLFHEAIGHRLEGERQRDEEEGRTFKGRVGAKVIPAFLSVFDDPTLERHAGEHLNGFYHFDDEGIAAQRVTLIEAGVLRGFLKSRTPIDGHPHSNGHGRAQGTQKPIARMANLIVQAVDPAHVVPYAELKRRLMAETKRQGKPFGLIIKDITGGSTNTSGYGYQAFKGSSRLIYKVDPETGAETLVRGAELVGTPLISINRIVAASQEQDVFNGYCGAESGYVPVSTLAPALLTTEIELQRSQGASARPPLLPAPWLDATK